MKWFPLAHKATRRFLNSQQFHHHGGSSYCSRYQPFHASEPMDWSKLTIYRMQFLNSCLRYCTSTSVSPHRFMNGTNNVNDTRKVDLEIISRETIKPASSTAHHLRNINLSILDQLSHDFYFPAILFIPNSNKASVTDVMSKRSKNLKETLSLILSQLYPLAGEFKNNLQIECNDKGAFYIEARVEQTLKEFLSHPDDEKIKELMPESPQSAESSIGNYLLGIQVNIFTCGGIGLSTSITHRIVDFHTYMIFMKAWAAAVRGSSETISPSIVASEVFPNDPTLEYSGPYELTNTELLSTKRFVFDPTSLALLKAQLVDSTSPTSRMEATTSVIWKAAVKAASRVRTFSPQSPHALVSVVNLRKRASPPFPENSIGNIFTSTAAICLPESQPDLPTILGKLRESIAKVDSNYIESLKGKKGHETVREMLKGKSIMAKMLEVGDCMIASSIMNSGIYELDFGWGKPIWFHVVNSGNRSFAVLNDTQKSGGVEATVTLSPDEMEIFERDSELLSYATVNPSPLQYLNH